METAAESLLDTVQPPPGGGGVYFAKKIREQRMRLLPLLP